MHCMGCGSIILEKCSFNEKKVKLLLVLDFINNNSGVSSVVMNYYSHIDKSKFQIDFLLYEEPGAKVLKHLQKRGSEVYALGHPVKLGITNYQTAIADFFKEHQNVYQIVHVHIPNAAFVVLKYAKKYGVKTRIIHSHNSKGADGAVKKLRNYFLNRQGIQYANQYYACSKSAGEYLYGKKQLKELVIINNAINLDKYQYNQESRRKIRKELGIEDELVIGHIGRFSKQKNHMFLIEIANQLKKRNVNFKLVLLGDGELTDTIKKQVEISGLDKEVIFIGVTRNAKEYMDAMDIFVLPSLYEGLPCVCVEAQANKLPCLVSDCVTREVALNDKIYFLKIDNESEWVEKILEYDIQKIRIQREDDASVDLKDYDIVVQAKNLEERYLAYENSSGINVNI